MTITLYVNWYAQEIYRNEKELVEGYLDYDGGRDIHFNEYLGDFYEPDTLFYATEEKQKEILEHYNTVIVENAKDWAKDHGMTITIEI